MRRLKTLIGLAVMGLALTAANQTANQKISPFVRAEFTNKNLDTTSVLIKLKGDADLKGAANFNTKATKAVSVVKSLQKTANKSQVELAKWLEAKDVKFQRFYIVNMIALYDVNMDTVAEVAARPEVERILSNPKTASLPKVVRHADRARFVAGPEANIAAIGATRVWAEYNNHGEGIVVAGQDTGIDWDHPALKNHYRGYNKETGAVDHTYNWHDAVREPIEGGSSCGYDNAEPCDDHDHGTHTIGTVVGDDGRGNQVGVAPGAQWIGCRNMDAGVGRPSTYIECFEFFLAPYPQGGDPQRDGDPTKAPHVINNSWGCPPAENCTEAEILPVLEALHAAGIMVVASAGNDGPGCSTIKDPPAMHSATTLSVGAHSHNSGNIASFSSRGPSKYDGEVGPDLTAPGVAIRSSVNGGGYQGGMWSGTSMAGPHAVGAVALLWKADPSLIGKIDETAEVLRQSATAKTTTESCGNVPGNARPNNTYGYGHLNVYQAIKSRGL